MSVDRCRREIRTHRESRTWLQFLQMQQNEPSKSDWYIMQLTDAVLSIPALVWGKRPKRINLGLFKLKFGTKKPPKNWNKKTVSRVSQAKWFAMTGYKRKEDDG